MSKGRSAGWVLSMALLMALAACDTNDNSIPDVAGTYSGDFLARRPDLDAERSGRMTAMVEQSGGQVTISGFVKMSGGLESLPLFPVTENIDETGVLANIISGGFYSSDFTTDRCGNHTRSSFTIAFTDNQMTWEEIYSTDLCGRDMYTTTKTRSS